MLAALKRLKYYCPDYRSFRYAVLALAALTLSSALLLVTGALGLGGSEIWGAAEYAVGAAELIADISVIVLSVLLFLGVHRLAGEVELPGLASRSVRMISYAAAYGLAAVISDAARITATAVTFSDKLAVVLNYTDFAAFILEYAFIFLCLAYFFTCYIRICLEGDEDMPYREDIFDKLAERFRKK